MKIEKERERDEIHLYHKECINNICKLNELNVNPNIPVFIPSKDVNTIIMKGHDGYYYVSTCDKYWWDEWDGFDYDSMGFDRSILEKMKKTWLYLSEYDVIGRGKKKTS